ncbi:hypothetical protein [Paraburkholderia sp. HP33-1]|uniref:hypothetical protein n=1 Tax=Paraburkholderia sp. HP33-1 TaxID=2883243 RepID=UPI001F22C121|nr:hypothetical protein [Paraburkholderia sp. HP33-1]
MNFDVAPVRVRRWSQTALTGAKQPRGRTCFSWRRVVLTSMNASGNSMRTIDSLTGLRAFAALLAIVHHLADNDGVLPLMAT